MITNIWIGKGMRNIKPDAPINTFRALHSFCVYNFLPSGRIAKLQGGYYILTNENTWKKVADTLQSLTFRMLYDYLGTLNLTQNENSN